MSSEYPLGRRIPSDWQHTARFPLRAVLPDTVASVERRLDVNSDWRHKLNQGTEGECVGYAATLMMCILNRVFLDARWLYMQAALADEWPETPYQESGTSVRAAMDVLRLVGHRRRVYQQGAEADSGASYPPDPRYGIIANRWAKTADEVRTCISRGVPAVLGCYWYSAFDRPAVVKRWFGLRRAEYWIGKGRTDTWGTIRGGHAIAIVGASDTRQAVLLCNSWGVEQFSGDTLIAGYPYVWLPYDSLQRLIDMSGECTVVTDRPEAPKVEQ